MIDLADEGIRQTGLVTIGTGGGGRMWSWAASTAEAEARRQDANELVGESIHAVRHYMLDYNREDLHPELVDRGPRLVDAKDELDKPTWLYDGFDAIDYGVDLHYVPRDEDQGSLWCPHITFHGEGSRVEVVMGDSRQGMLGRSADNVAVLHPDTDLPEWLSTAT